MTSFLGRETWHNPIPPASGIPSITGGDYWVPYSVCSSTSNDLVSVPGRHPNKWEDGCNVYIYLYFFNDAWRYCLNDSPDRSMDDIKTFGQTYEPFTPNISDEHIYSQTTPSKRGTTYVDGMQFTTLDVKCSYVCLLGTYIKKRFLNSHPVVIRTQP